MARLGVLLWGGALGIAVLLIGARLVAERLETRDDDRECLSLHFVNETGLAASYELDSDRFRDSFFVGGPFFSQGSPEHPWVSDPAFVRAVPIEGFGGPGEWLSIAGAHLDVRITLRDEAQTQLATSVVLRGGEHVECRVTAEKRLDERHGRLGWLGVRWDAD